MTGDRPNLSVQDGEKLLRRFEEAWKAGASPNLATFLPPLPKAWQEQRALHALVVELIGIDLEYRWREGGGGGEARRTLPPRPQLEDYVRAFPQLGPAESLPVELILAEYDARRLAGAAPSLEDLVARFPSRADLLGSLLLQREANLSATTQATCALDSSTRLESGGTGPASALLPVLQAIDILPKNQLDELTRAVGSGQLTTMHAALNHALERGWLTPFQAEQLLQGRGPQLVQGAYILLQQIGEGGMSKVYRARHRIMQRTVAFKVIRRQLIADAGETAVRRFYQEIQAVGRLSHPNIIHAYDAGPIGGTHFLAMEYVDGIDLARLLRRRGPLPVAQACEYIRQAALALQHAFECGLVHRDLKPSNLLIADCGLGIAESGARPQSAIPNPQPPIVKILDLGLASLRWSDAAGSATALTGVGSFLGTPDYIAPEQALDPTRADIRADLYSLGCTLYHLLAGSPPFPGGTLAQKLNRHLEEAPPALEQARPDVPPAVAAIVKRLLAKRPEERFQTPRELAMALAAIAPAPPRRSRRLVFAAAAVGAVVLIVSGGAVFVASQLASSRSVKVVAPPAQTRETPDQLVSPLDRLDPATLSAEDRGTSNKGLVALVRAQKSPSFAVSLTANGAILVTGGPSDPAIHIWDVKDGRLQERCVLSERQGVHAVALAPDGRMLVSAGVDGSARLWDLAATPPRRLETFPGVGGCFETAVFSPDGRTLALGGADGHVRLLDASVAPPSIRHDLAGHAGNVESLMFSRDSKLLATGGADGVIFLWELTGSVPRQRGVLRGHSGSIFGLGFAPDGKTLASGSTDRTIRFWDIASARPRPSHVVREHTGNVTATCFTSDGKFLYSAANDGRVIRWKLPALTRQDEWRLPGAIHRAILAPDQRHFLTANDNGTTAILRVAERPSSR
jgi:serine/threonine-protein kinase